MAQFVGKYYATTDMESENMDEYFKVLGFNYIVRKASTAMTWYDDIRMKPDNWFSLTISCAVFKQKWRFQLDVPFEDETPDGLKAESVVKIENERVLVFKQTVKKTGEVFTIVRAFDGDDMKMTNSARGVVAMSMYKKSQD